MTDTLQNKFDTLETQLSTQNTATQAALTALGDTLSAINTALELINENNAANTKYLLAAIGQSAACFPCPTPTIAVPPLSSTPIPLNTEGCQRAQAFVAAIGSILQSFDTMQSFNVVGTFNVLNDAISQVVSAIAAGDTIPLPSFPETVNIVGDYISYAGERAFSGVGLVDQYTPLQTSLINALYGAGSPEAAIAAWNTAIDASGASNGAKLLFKALAYAALANYYFSTTSSPDLSGFDGSICAVPSGTCYTPSSALITVTSGGSGSEWAVVGEFGPFIGQNHVNSSSGPVTFDSNAWFGGDFTGWTMEVLSGNATFQYRSAYPDGFFSFAFAGPFTSADGVIAFPTGAHTIHIIGSDSFAVRLCYSTA